VNTNGWTAGSSGAGTAKKPFVYKWNLGGGSAKTLGLPSGFPIGSVFGINGKGHATGSFENPSGTAEHPFLYNGTSLRDLGTLGGALAAGNAINASDAVVGSSLTSTPNTFHPFLWRGGTMRDLGTLGGPNGSAFGIDAAGQVTGSASIPGPSGFHAFMWNGSMHDLGALPGYQWSAGLSIANGGMVAGYSVNPGGLQLATVWGSGGPLSLGTLPGDRGSVATGVNPSGWVVGRSFTDPTALPHPFLWTAGTMQPLQSLVPPSSGWRLFDATSINELGQIGGDGVLDGHVRGFLLSPPLADRLQPLADKIESGNLAKPLPRRTGLGYYLRAAIVALDANRPQRACTDLREFATAVPREQKAGRYGDRATVAEVAELRISYGCR
jgi:probable HAF family extracellular repeat protein